MIGEASRWRETWSGTPKTTCATPGGRPASSRARRTSSAAPGASSAGLTMTLQPAAIGAPSLRAGLAIGKFQGAKAATGPIGSFMTRLRAPTGRTRTRP